MGSTPRASAKRYGGLPPATAIAWEYRRPCVAGGKAWEVSTVIGGAMTICVEGDFAPSGFTTVIVAIPVVAITPAGTAAINRLEEDTEVVSEVWFQSMRASGAKPLPVTVSVKAPEPTVTEAGLIAATHGVCAAAREQARSTSAVEKALCMARLN